MFPEGIMNSHRFSRHFAAKTVILTGAGSGLGMAICRELAASGAIVHALDINQDGLGVVTGWSDLPGRVSGHQVDVSDAESMARVIGEIIAHEGKIDFLFNNAGVTLIGESHTIGFEKNKRLLDINLMGVIRGTHLIYPQMVRQGNGHIVNTASVAGATGYVTAAAYAASKAAVLEFTRSLRAEAVGHGVMVSAACPGYVDSGIFAQERIIGMDRAELIKSLPVKMISPEDAAKWLLKGVCAKSKTNVFPASANLLWHLASWVPSALQPIHKRFLRDFQRASPRPPVTETGSGS